MRDPAAVAGSQYNQVGVSSLDTGKSNVWFPYNGTSTAAFLAALDFSLSLRDDPGGLGRAVAAWSRCSGPGENTARRAAIEPLSNAKEARPDMCIETRRARLRYTLVDTRGIFVNSYEAKKMCKMWLMN